MQEFSIFIAPLLFMFFGLVTYLESDLPHRRLGYRVLSVKQTVETWRVSNKFAAKWLTEWRVNMSFDKEGNRK